MEWRDPGWKVTADLSACCSREEQAIREVTRWLFVLHSPCQCQAGWQRGRRLVGSKPSDTLVPFLLVRQPVAHSPEHGHHAVCTLTTSQEPNKLLSCPALGTHLQQRQSEHVGASCWPAWPH